MSAIDGKKIAIVGGGPGGLTLARLLQMHGAEVAVYERDTSRDARIQGSALDLHEDSGLAALQAAGLMDAFWANHRSDLDRLRLTDQHGTILHDHQRTMSGAGKRPEIERGPLRELLLESLHADTVHWDRKLESAVHHDGKVALQFADGDTVLADIVIGCDGANSRLRAFVTPNRPYYVGITLVEGSVPAAKDTVPELWDLLGGAALMALGNERTLGMGTKPDGSLLFYAGVKSPVPNGKQQLEEAGTAGKRKAWFYANFEGWSERWAPLFAEASSLVWRPLLSCPADQYWDSLPNATLIGDAAHVMPPYAGEGVNMAMLDALVLSRQLLNGRDAASAITAYETEMFARMRHMAEDTMSNTEIFYAPDASTKVVAMFQGFARRSSGDVPVSAASN
ncbi:2-polyprenyl-6-methoxyphenol hydroxylase [Bryocella elongata]|uniref:Flavin-dependent monooxygenase n=1 Tax=Bryocella elongata TaxID=863522 RepID=A0A1H5WBB1_9BACT|nr:NAD(P)/FAD-dependent oxidoreductase [Bryocella elongata]SEF96754.1 2-polyprenyl-6-methoxyphenol hydroxylase [Bryocella elongata]